MAARDYDHLFKLLIIGDSGKCQLNCVFKKVTGNI